MKFYGLLTFFLGFIIQEDGRRKRIQELVRSIARTKKQKKQKLIGKDTHMENPKKVRGIPRITLDDDAQVLCKKYKMMCKTDKICAVQHFDWPNNITIPVCIPLSFVPAEYSHIVRNRICQQPPATGRCHARYIRWYYNIHAQECSHFQYGGCEGNGNNFMSKRDCEQTCIATPTIKLYEGGGSSLLVQPSIITAPIYEPPKNKEIEALNSIRDPSGSYNRYELKRHRGNRMRSDEAATRTRRRLEEKEKEKKRRERRKEKKRLRKLQKKEQRKLRCKKRRERGKRCRKDKKDRKGRKNKKKKMPIKTANENDVSSDKNTEVKENTNQVVEESKNLLSSEIVAEDDVQNDVKETKREKRRRKRKLKEKRRLEKERNRRNLSSRNQRRYSELNKKSESYSAKLFSILDQGRYQKGQQKNSLLHTLS